MSARHFTIEFDLDERDDPKLGKRYHGVKAVVKDSEGKVLVEVETTPIAPVKIKKALGEKRVANKLGNAACDVIDGLIADPE